MRARSVSLTAASRATAWLGTAWLAATWLAAGWLAAAGSISVAAAQHPPRRMHEVTPRDRHVFFRAKGMWGYADATGEYALAADGAALLVIDVTDPAAPVIASRVTGGHDLKEVKTYKHYAVCVNQSGPLQIVDLSDPYHAYTAAAYISPTIPGAHNVWVDDDGFAYLAMQGSGTSDLRILDLRDPLHPVERGHWRHPNQSGFVCLSRRLRTGQPLLRRVVRRRARDPRRHRQGCPRAHAQDRLSGKPHAQRVAHSRRPARGHHRRGGWRPSPDLERRRGIRTAGRGIRDCRAGDHPQRPHEGKPRLHLLLLGGGAGGRHERSTRSA